MAVTGARAIHLYGLYLALLLITYYVQWPIVAFDTDLWTHLNGGRFMFEQGRIPHSTFYSFIEPAREFVNYTWLFKAVVYAVFSVFGYGGLIAVRTALCLATLLLVYQYLHGSRLKRWTAPVLLLYFMLFVDIGSEVRPYGFSYLMIICFLFVLEHHPRKAYLLPLLAILWVNIHGIEYPVMLVIITAYLLDSLLRRGNADSPPAPGRVRYRVALCAAMAMVFFTPSGARLLQMPFAEISYTPMYIAEFQPIRLKGLFSFHMDDLRLNYRALMNLFVIGSGAAFLVGMLMKRVRVKHAILYAAGLFLLLKGTRFIHEFSLLTLPLLCAVIGSQGEEKSTKPRRRVFVPVLIVLILLPLIHLHDLYGNRGKFPLAHDGLPEGIAAFLKQVDAGGKVLNDPATGGYMAWALGQRYRIYMDMQVPFPFTDEDMFRGLNAGFTPEGFTGMVSRYRPDFVALPLVSPVNQAISKIASNYVMVFFDDREALYVDSNRHPRVAEEYHLQVLNPAVAGRFDRKGLSETEENRFIQEALQMERFYPEGFLINRTLVKYYYSKGEYAKAGRYADRIVRHFPNRPEGSHYKGDALRAQKDFSGALISYKKALGRANPAQKPELYKKLWACYFSLGRYPEAYRILKTDLNYFAPETGFIDLYHLGMTALQIGSVREARMLAEFAYFKVPKDDLTWEPRIKKLLKVTGKP